MRAENNSTNNDVVITRQANSWNHFHTIVFGKGVAIGLTRKI